MHKLLTLYVFNVHMIDNALYEMLMVRQNAKFMTIMWTIHF